MQPVILVVEDHPDILYNIDLTLQYNDYQVITASNGKEALKVLSTLENPPDLIISDILMPKMNGYDFFKAVSENPYWSHIPFFFLTARTSPEDIRFGKMLGADDYITKPFRKQDLLASVAGKLTRVKKISNFKQKIENDLLSSLEFKSKPSLTIEDKSSLYLLLVVWDENRGPELKDYYPGKQKPPFSLENVGVQLFHSAVSIYGHADDQAIEKEKSFDSQGVLLEIKNINMHGYVFFDSRDEKTTRGGKQLFLVTVIAPKITYFESLKIRESLVNLAARIRNNEKANLREYWEKILKIVTTPVSDLILTNSD